MYIKLAATQVRFGRYDVLRNVVWPRYKKRDARFAAGLESSFSSFGETSLVVLTHRCQMLNGGEAAEGA